MFAGVTHSTETLHTKHLQIKLKIHECGECNLEMLPENQEEEATLGSGDVLEEASHVMRQPAEHAVLVLIQVLVIYHLLPPCLHVHLHLILGRKLQTLLDALKDDDKSQVYSQFL